MKAKVFITLYVLVFCAFILSGCTANESEARIAGEFSADFNADYNTMKLSGSLTFGGQSLLYLRLNSPETLSGLEAEIKGGSLTLEQNGLISTADEAYIPASGFPRKLKSALSAVSSGRLTKEDDGSYRLSNPDGELVADENGFIKKITLNNLTVEFFNQKPVG